MKQTDTRIGAINPIGWKIMRKALTINLTNPGRTDMDLRVVIPLHMIAMARQILPVRLKLFLEGTGVDITPIGELPPTQECTRELIEIENPDGKMAIAIEDIS